MLRHSYSDSPRARVDRQTASDTRPAGRPADSDGAGVFYHHGGVVPVGCGGRTAAGSAAAATDPRRDGVRLCRPRRAGRDRIQGCAGHRSAVDGPGAALGLCADGPAGPADRLGPAGVRGVVFRSGDRHYACGGIAAPGQRQPGHDVGRRAGPGAGRALGHGAGAAGRTPVGLARADFVRVVDLQRRGWPWCGPLAAAAAGRGRGSRAALSRPAGHRRIGLLGNRRQRGHHPNRPHGPARPLAALARAAGPNTLGAGRSAVRR